MTFELIAIVWIKHICIWKCPSPLWHLYKNTIFAFYLFEAKKRNFSIDISFEIRKWCTKYFIFTTLFVLYILEAANKLSKVNWSIKENVFFFRTTTFIEGILFWNDWNKWISMQLIFIQMNWLDGKKKFGFGTNTTFLTHCG